LVVILEHKFLLTRNYQKRMINLRTR